MLRMLRRQFGSLLLPHLTLLQRFMVLCAVVLLVTAVALGERISSNVQRDMARSTAFNTALYISSVVGTELEKPDGSIQLTSESRHLLDRLFSTERLGSEIVAVKVWSQDGDVVYSTDPSVVGRRFPIDRELAGALKGEVLYEVAGEKEENLREREQFTRLIEVYAPIHSQASGKIIGASEVYQRIDRIPDFISASRREVWLVMALAFGLLYAALSGIVRQAGATIDRQNVQLRAVNRALAERAVTDFLTGLYNHRYFQERLQDEVEQARRTLQPLSLLFCDLDHFKDLNDMLGHQAGDLVLHATGDIIRTTIRSTDVAARYGGEEYTVLLLRTNKERAIEVAERIRSCVEENAIALPDGRHVQVTVSVGVAAFPGDATHKEALLEEADRAMYAAKSAGRNRVVGCPLGKPAEGDHRGPIDPTAPVAATEPG